MNEQRILYVFLKNATAISATGLKVCLLTLDDVVGQLFNIFEDLNAVTSIRRLAWLVYPDVTFFMFS